MTNYPNIVNSVGKGGVGLAVRSRVAASVHFVLQHIDSKRVLKVKNALQTTRVGDQGSRVDVAHSAVTETDGERNVDPTLLDGRV